MGHNYCYNIANLEFTIEKNEIIRGLNCDIKEGEITTIIGPNGCGKSTLLQILTKIYTDYSGSVSMYGRSIETIKMKEFARKVAIGNQYNTAQGDISVKQLVGYGRIPYKNLAISHMNDEDEEKINWALEITEMKQLEDEKVSSLSGGQKQRAWIAMALAQNTKVLFLDEPTTYLDIKYQREILEIVEKLNDEHDITIVMVLHDINQAIRYSHNIIAMKDGKIHSTGDAKTVVTEKLIKDVYGIDVELFKIGEVKYLISF